jgi:hypothetical protein
VPKQSKRGRGRPPESEQDAAFVQALLSQAYTLNPNNPAAVMVPICAVWVSRQLTTELRKLVKVVKKEAEATDE